MTSRTVWFLPFWCFALILAHGYSSFGQNATRKPVKVFVLAGQSNMEGKAKLELLEYQVHAPETRDYFKHLRKNGQWMIRNDVWINFLNRRGNLTVGFGSPRCFGPELEFGNVVGDHFEEPVLLIKTAWGGKSLGRDFRPPSSGWPDEATLRAELEKTNEQNRKQNKPATTMEEMIASYGRYYREMLKEVDTVLRELPARFPAYENQGYELAGLVWFQGWNDLFDPAFRRDYTMHLANLIRDVRQAWDRPELPIVIGQMGQGGVDGASQNVAILKAAQAAVADIPELRGQVKVVRTDEFWDAKAAGLVDNWRDHEDAWKKVGSDYGYHYLGSAITFCSIGRAFGLAMLELLEE